MVRWCLLVVFTILLTFLFGGSEARTFAGGSDAGRKYVELEYPYKRLYKSKREVEAAFGNVKKYELEMLKVPYTIKNLQNVSKEDLKFGDEQVIIKVGRDDYEKMNWISDWFNEKCRVRCKRFDEPESALEYWTKNKKTIVDFMGKGRRLGLSKLNDYMYEKVMGCGTFRPGLMTGMIKYFGAKSVLDPSAGWGDRLLGAIAAGVRYVGVDPNTCLHEGYAKMVDTFAAGAKEKFTLICEPFQSAALPDEMYDLVFTSPPYFDLEVYSDEPTQSVREFGDVAGWMDGFLMPCMERAVDLLNEGGHLVVSINDPYTGPKYTMEMVSRIKKNVKYLGVMSYAEVKGDVVRSPQPLWMWQKV